MQIPFPIFAPKALNKNTLMPMNGFHDALTIIALTKYHSVCLMIPAPLSKPDDEKRKDLPYYS